MFFSICLAASHFALGFLPSSNKLDGKNPNAKWKAAKQISGIKPSGPPNQLTVQGQPVRSPSKLADVMNKHYINKIKSIRSNFKRPQNDPCAGLRQ